VATGARQDRQRAPVTDGSRGELVARLQDPAQLDEGIRQVRAARALGAGVGGDGAAAIAFGGGKAAGRPVGDGAFVSRNGPGCLIAAGDGRLRRAIVPSASRCPRGPSWRPR
jgi:hypothetical protein